MSITIDGKTADITLEGEKTVGELVKGVSDWLLGSGFVVSGIDVDGAFTPASALEEAFSVELARVRSVNVRTALQAEMCLDALFWADDVLCRWDAASALERPAIGAQWRAGPAASCLREKDGAAYQLIEEALAGKNKDGVRLVIDERTRELEDPCGEFLAVEGEMRELSSRLSDVALDVQTGKDLRAAETIRLFSAFSAKLLRLIPLLRSFGIELDKLSLEKGFFEDFNSILKELLAAYQAEDAVLSGDLAEYEVAPRLNALYMSVKDQLQYKM
ncbi:MAG: hypothetical protein LBS82_02620 [Spirochaetaceae bacterium]|nr:hypothetical protein [Spirochaetaceae bacterium]